MYLCYDPVVLVLAGADTSGRPLMYTPNPFQGGSSVSHWDVTLSPNALMEPAINNDLHDTVDLTLGHFKDIGWFTGTVPVYLQDFVALGRADGIQLSWKFTDPTEVASVAVERAENQEGPWGTIAPVMGQQGSMTTALDSEVAEGRDYFYRLRVVEVNGDVVALGMASGRREIAYVGRFNLGSPVPNPANRNGTIISFQLGRSDNVQLVVHDVRGRTVRTLASGVMLAGAYTRHWDGVVDGGTSAPAGIYFLTLSTSTGKQTQRVTILR
jgi:hypothetical protein